MNDDPRRVVKSGHLYKRGVVNKAYKERFFVLLEDGALQYFKAKASARAIAFVSCVAAVVSRTPDPRGIELRVPGRTYQLLAETAAERDRWFEALASYSVLHQQSALMATYDEMIAAATCRTVSLQDL
jgi:hypothetical protein